ncbi:unannotated protein [freshwater metagenome]|uniref:Unannotated protein n=1 Tax=freshwater metagenome TaxID=449393 RepID=A0A6J7D811_9ZZZZ
MLEWASEMHCVVTGGAGFIGSTLVDRLLESGHHVDVIDDLSSGRLRNLENAQSSDRMTLHEVDIRKSDVVELIVRLKPEVIFHLAAQADVRRSVADPVFDASINILGTLHVLEGARLSGTRRVVAAASGGTLYGEPGPNEIPTPETAPYRPLSPYGVSKKSMIDYLVAYQELHGIECVALALANVYGPRQDPHGEAGVVAIFTERLLHGEPITIFGTGNQTRDFIYVDDVVDAFVNAVDRGKGLVINIGTGSELSVNEIYAAMADIASTTAAPTFAPARPGELDRSCLNIKRASDHLEWRPRTGFADGVQLTIDSFRGLNS